MTPFHATLKALGKAPITCRHAATLRHLRTTQREVHAPLLKGVTFVLLMSCPQSGAQKQQEQVGGGSLKHSQDAAMAALRLRPLVKQASGTPVARLVPAVLAFIKDAWIANKRTPSHLCDPFLLPSTRATVTIRGCCISPELPLTNYPGCPGTHLTSDIG